MRKAHDSLGARKEDMVAQSTVEATGDHGVAAIAIVEQAMQAHVDTMVWMEIARGLHGPGFIAQEQAADIDAVGTNVEQAAATPLRIEPNIVRCCEMEAEGGFNGHQTADAAAGDQFASLFDLWVVSIHEGLDQMPVGGAGGGDHFLALGCVTAQGFFAQNVLATLECAECQLTVQTVVGGDIDCFDIIVVEQGLVVVVCPLGPEAAGAFEVAAGCRCQRCRGHVTQCRDEEVLGDAAGADDTEPDGWMLLHGRR